MGSRSKGRARAESPPSALVGTSMVACLAVVQGSGGGDLRGKRYSILDIFNGVWNTQENCPIANKQVKVQI